MADVKEDASASVNDVVEISTLASASDTLPLRERVLWPGHPEMCHVPGDDAALHLGAVQGASAAVVGVLSLFPVEGDTGRCQFRKFAVAPEL
eukprot:gnl/TRDRNA2_/TRDRNA2_171922_c0_seq1.p3 gnl/TRDRNA2_/TRDRNA2_171922_c0~~gnl/TRDRNA2_/TRDRNA2_171922_c0_seq1.p3  ORF type:complete len:105 (-),score=20.33 gnl/TRDRNA2_/TRDRNA2_171922_c0_seq1:517-792(-)